DPFTVGDFEKGALKVLHGIFKKATSAVLVGGSGLYVDAVVKGLDHFPKTGPGHRRDLNSIFEKKGMLPLQNELEQTDPEYFAIVDAHNKQRVIRALEVIRETGRPFSSFLKKETHARDFNTVFVGLQAPRQVVYQRINQRVDVMMKRGLLDEARRLYPHKNLNALKTVGYKELFGYFEGKTNLGAAVAEIKKNTRRYAKRQHTWFKKNKGILWFDHKTDALTIVKEVKNQEVF
ncbi:MAG: tRNA (adenosine(37)-N6)-dimethylallyltransferase MiaA, partial [Marinirhabdus sp.]